MAEKSFKRDLTEGSVALGLLAFALPLFASNALQVVYNVVDIAVVGHVLGKVGMSGVAIGGDILHFITALAMGFCSASQIIIAQNIGAKRMDDVKKIIGTIFTFLFCLSIGLSVLCYLFRYQLLALLSTPEESFVEAYQYSVTSILGIVFVYGYNAVSAILRGMGDSKRPFTFVAIAAIANAILDVLFVVVMDLRGFGAALATVMGQGISFIISIIYLYKKRDALGFDFKPQSFKISLEHLKVLLSLGIPMTIQYAAINFSRIVVARWINSFGVTASAVSAVFNKISQIVSLFANAVFTSGGAMIGQNIGAEKYKRVTQILITSISFMCVTNGLLALAINVLPNQIFSIFTSDASVIVASQIIVFPLTLFTLSGILRTPGLCLIMGSGNAKLNLVIALLDGIVCRIGFAYMFTFILNYGHYGCFLSEGLSSFVPPIVAIVYYVSGKWKTNKYLLKRQLNRAK